MWRTFCGLVRRGSAHSRCAVEHRAKTLYRAEDGGGVDYDPENLRDLPHVNHNGIVWVKARRAKKKKKGPRGAPTISADRVLPLAARAGNKGKGKAKAGARSNVCLGPGAAVNFK